MTEAKIQTITFLEHTQLGHYFLYFFNYRSNKIDRNFIQQSIIKNKYLTLW